MTVMKCGRCGFVGNCYGIGHMTGVSAPFCTRCGRNNCLTEVALERDQTEDILKRPRVEDYAPLSMRHFERKRLHDVAVASAVLIVFCVAVFGMAVLL